MKKTLITFLALTGVASAAITDGLVWAEAFGDGLTKAPAITLNNAFHVENNVGIAGNSYADSRIWTTNLSGGNFTDAFTFSFRLIDFEADNWTNALSFYTNGVTYGDNANVMQLQKSAAGNLMVYTSSFTGSNVSGDASNINLGSVDSLKGKVLTLTYADDVVTAYVDGVALSDTITFTYAEGVTPSKALTGFQFGAAFGNLRTSTSVTVDDIGLWNRSLSAVEITSLVPEPATATLSLLALCGLAARRRRK